MHLDKIIVPVDFSVGDDSVVRMALSMARDFDAHVIVAHVEEPPLTYAAGEMYYGVPTPERPELRNMLEGVVPANPGVELELRLVTGDPAMAIVELAEEENADMIIMGTHGRTGLTRLVMGSVAEAVVRRANCPVLTCRIPVHQMAAH
jgi:nucleotide-binding universal stress UspA family protein